MSWQNLHFSGRICFFFCRRFESLPNMLTDLNINLLVYQYFGRICVFLAKSTFFWQIFGKFSKLVGKLRYQFVSLLMYCHNLRFVLQSLRFVHIHKVFQTCWHI